MSHLLRRVQAVVFDLDDTLLDWSRQTDWLSNISGSHIQNVYDYLAENGNSLPTNDVLFQNYQEAIIHSWREAKKTWAGVNFESVLMCAFETSGLDVSKIDMGAVLLAYDWGTVPNVTLFDDTVPVLDSLRQQGYKIGLVTNSMMPMWMRDIELREYGILDYFDARITSGDTGHMKPHPAIYERVLDLLEVEAETAVFVGDRPANDIAGANAVGLTSVWMNPPHLSYELGDVIPDYEITTLQELLPILAALENR
ncbi:MAG: HAD family hydrolase [Anaerolineae bacterium]|nr:HAD family hydrolase [Anaerolineae bacterium]